MNSRRKSKPIQIGRVTVGGDAPIVVQSMTKTDTRDIMSTITQIKELEDCGCELVRVAVPDAEAARAISPIKKGVSTPLIADIHFDYRLALMALEAGCDGLRLNPGNISQPEKIKEIADLPRGLVLVTGHTGAGKSTTLASTIGLINTKYRKRVITIEDPIEYWLLNDMCMIEQREVGSDCPDFATGLRHILRQDPDVIMVGEMRDLETTSFTLTAAETGHLVFSTLHTPNASQSIERVIDIYPANQQTQARTMLANALQADFLIFEAAEVDDSNTTLLLASLKEIDKQIIVNTSHKPKDIPQGWSVIEL